MRNPSECEAINYFIIKNPESTTGSLTIMTMLLVLFPDHQTKERTNINGLMVLSLLTPPFRYTDVVLSSVSVMR